MNLSILRTTLVTGLGACAFLMAACGGGGGGGSSTATGYFKDASVIGMHYATASHSGETGAGGSFAYEPGETVTFSVGGLVVGSVTASPVVTPIDLVSSGTSSSTPVVNRVRFLMALDDGTVVNAIHIPAGVLAAASGWTTPDFTSTNFDSNVASMLTTAASNGSTGALPTASAAQTQLQATVLCAYAGGYKGSYTGADQGKFGFMVDAQSGNVIGLYHSTLDFTTGLLSGSVPMTYDASRSFVSGSTSTGATFSGGFPDANSVSGNWSGGSGTGTFSGQRIGGSPTAQYRFTGSFTSSDGTDGGLFTFDVSGAYVTGVGYSVTGDNLFAISGSLAGTALTATATSGSHSYAISANLDTGTGTLSSGVWSGNSKSGTFVGGGCRLN